MIHPFQIYNKSSILFLSFWVIVIILHTIIFNAVLQIDFKISVTDSLVYNISFGTISYSLWYFIKSYGTEKKIVFLFITNLIVALIITTVWVYLSNLIVDSLIDISKQQVYNEINQKSFLIRGIIGIFYYGLIVSAYYVYLIYQNFSQKKLREKELNKMLMESELRTLKYQINPHFVFNTLNSISSLTLISPEKAREMTVKLSDFMRSTFAKKDDKFILLDEELKSIRNYLEIEKIRFEDKFEFIEKISEECSNKKIPNFILQPIIENAIKHGVYESLDKVNINLSCEPKDDFLEIKVSNNYEEKSTNGEGVGLKNVKERLKLIYGNELLLKVDDRDNVFTVTIFIPKEN